MDASRPLRFAVIGGGVAGVEAATRISETYPDAQVVLFEKYRLLTGSSSRTPGRLGLGFHYANETAFQILEASISVQRKYPGYLVGQDLPQAHPLRHGRYFVTKDSTKSFSEIIDFYHQLQAHYAELVAADPLNAVFGAPESFFRVLDPSEYADSVNMDLVVGAIETNEHLFNFDAFAQDMRQKFKKHPKIELYESTEIIDLKRRHIHGAACFELIAENTFSMSKIVYQADFVINSTWENIEYLNSKLDIPFQQGSRTNRLKAVVKIRLPLELQDAHSAFFCMGPFGMFSNLGNREGLITLAEITNLATSSELRITKEMERLINDNVDRYIKADLGYQILEGVKKYLPLLEKARVIDVRYGIVQTQGYLNIKSLASEAAPHHHRNYLGVREEMQGLISNPAVKLFNFVKNGDEVLFLIDRQLKRHQLNLALTTTIAQRNSMLEPFVFYSQHVQERLDKMLLPLDISEADKVVIIKQIESSLLSVFSEDDVHPSSEEKKGEVFEDDALEGLTDNESEQSAKSFEDRHPYLHQSKEEIYKQTTERREQFLFVSLATLDGIIPIAKPVEEDMVFAEHNFDENKRAQSAELIRADAKDDFCLYTKSQMREFGFFDKEETYTLSILGLDSSSTRTHPA